MKELIQILNKQIDADLSAEISRQDLLKKLSALIDDLIKNNFQKLVSVLYKVDINEKKLKDLLQANKNKIASEIIADLIIERQLQKIESRKNFSKNNDISDEEKW